MVLLILLEPLVALSLVVAISRVGSEDEPANSGAGNGVGDGGSGAAAARGSQAALPQPGAVARQQVASGLMGSAIACLTILLKIDTRHATAMDASCLALCVLLILVPLALLPALAPACFERHRHSIRAGVRLALFCMPNFRSNTAIAHVLQGQPSQQRLGVIKDTLSFILGTPTLALAITPVLVPLPMLPHLALSAFALYWCRATTLMCSLPMLRHATWQSRISWVHAAVDQLPLLVPQRRLHPARMAATGDSTGDCQVLVAFLQLLVALVLPTMFVAVAAGISSRPHASTNAASGGSSDGGSAQGGRRTTRWLSCVAGWLRRAAVEAEASIQHLCGMLIGGAASWVLTLAAWWLLLSLLWVLALVMVGA